VEKQMWEGVRTFSDYDPNRSYAVPRAHTMTDQIKTAVEFREGLAKECTRVVCGVCSMYRRDCEVKQLGIEEVPNLELLNVNGDKTPELPRDALTRCTWVDQDYCLQPAGCEISDDGQVLEVSVCEECLAALNRDAVPPASLVRFDTGEVDVMLSLCVRLTLTINTPL
jgi:hypothetical protein